VDIMKCDFSAFSSRDFEAPGMTPEWCKQYGYLIWP